MERRRRRQPATPTIEPPRPSLRQKIDGVLIDDVSVKNGRVLMEGTIQGEDPTVCESCGGRMNKAYNRERRLVDLPLSGKPSELVLKIKVFRCADCGKKHSLSSSELDRGRITKRAVHFIASQTSPTNADIAKRMGLSERSIRNIKKEFSCARPF